MNMVATTGVSPISGLMQVPITNGKLDLRRLARDYPAELERAVGVPCKLGLFYDVAPNSPKYDPKTDTPNGRLDLPISVQQSG